MTWLILGGHGQLARAMESRLITNGVEYFSLSREQLDVTDSFQVAREVRRINPKVIFNAAAWTNVDEAENYPELAREINSIAPGIIAKEASYIDARLIHISTDYVFSGKSSIPWSENAVLDPSSEYGRSKAAGEVEVMRFNPSKTLIVRTAWLYSPWGKNFVKTMITLARKNSDNVSVVMDEVGQPTSALDLSSQILTLADKGVESGVFHGTNSGQTSWFNFAQEIFSLLHEDPTRVVPIQSAEYPRLAQRPSYSALGHHRWFEADMEPMRDWRQALAQDLPSIVEALAKENH